MSQDRKLLARVKSRKLKYFGHATRHNSLEKDIMLGTVPEKGDGEDKRNNGLTILPSGQVKAWWAWSAWLKTE